MLFVWVERLIGSNGVTWGADGMNRLWAYLSGGFEAGNVVEQLGGTG